MDYLYPRSPASAIVIATIYTVVTILVVIAVRIVFGLPMDMREILIVATIFEITNMLIQMYYYRKYGKSR